MAVQQAMNYHQVRNPDVFRLLVKSKLIYNTTMNFTERWMVMIECT
jgi:hypothetical protein